MSREEPLVCPVCRARFRGEAECPRCSADLTALMLLSAHAYRLRQAARQALVAGDFATALSAAERAEDLHSTSQGRLLWFISQLAAAD